MSEPLTLAHCFVCNEPTEVPEAELKEHEGAACPECAAWLQGLPEDPDGTD